MNDNGFVFDEKILFCEYGPLDIDEINGNLFCIIHLIEIQTRVISRDLFPMLLICTLSLQDMCQYHD